MIMLYKYANMKSKKLNIILIFSLFLPFYFFIIFVILILIYLFKVLLYYTYKNLLIKKNKYNLPDLKLKEIFSKNLNYFLQI